MSGQRWCTGTLIGRNLFLTAGHCLDSVNDPTGWRVPLDNVTNLPIPSAEIATRMHVNFNYQVDPTGIPRVEQSFAINDLIEYRLGGLDFAILQLAGNPEATYGRAVVASTDARVGDVVAIIGHPAGERKRIEAGPVSALFGNGIFYNDIDTLGGNSGSGIFRLCDK